MPESADRRQPLSPLYIHKFQAKKYNASTYPAKPTFTSKPIRQNRTVHRINKLLEKF